jgi:hypothetical protein
MKAGLRKLVAVLAVLLAGSCSTQSLQTVHLDEIPSDKAAAIEGVPEIEALPSQAYTDLGAVEGISCKRSSREVASWEDAIRRTKYRALQKGGNAIANLVCEAPKASFMGRITSAVAPTCMESIRCTASAVKR